LNSFIAIDPIKLKPIQFTVVTGVDPEAWGRPNNVSPTSSGDLLFKLGIEKYRREIAASARLIVAWERGALGKMLHSDGSGFIQIWPEEIEDAVRRHPALTDIRVPISKDLVGSRLPKSAYYAAQYLICKISPIAGERFFQELHDGLGYTAGSPIKALRDRIISVGQKESVRAALVLAWIVKAWNAYVEKKPLKIIRFGDTEAFPIIRSEN
jgi:hypothetical protein